MVNVKSLDLNLVRVFDALMEDRSVQRASLRVGVTPSALSHSLNRLRYHLNDELFVRTRSGMIPTARALEISGPLREALRVIDTTLGGDAFDPLTTTRRFVLAANDMMTATIGARLMAILATAAPGVDLVIRPATRIDLAEQVDVGLIDVALGVFADVPSRFDSAAILPLNDVAVMRNGHPAAGDLSLDALGRFPLAAISLGGPEAGAVDGFILERGLARQSDAFDRTSLEGALNGVGMCPRYGLLTPHFMALPPALQETGLIAIVPSLLVPFFRAAGLTAGRLPYAAKPAMADLVWNRRSSKDTGHTWFRSLLSRIATDLAGAEPGWPNG